MPETTPTVVRYFVAIPLPSEAKDWLLALQPDAGPGLRLIGPEELHLTLHFVGELPPGQDVAIIHRPLATVKVEEFSFLIRGIGRFPPDGQAQVLWAGVQDNADLLALHRSIGAALAAAIGFQPEARPYSPHISLARVGPSASEVRVNEYLAKHEDVDIGLVPVNQFALYSSQFKDNVPQYVRRAVYRLK